MSFIGRFMPVDGWKPDSDAVDAAWSSQFGARLFNLYTLERDAAASFHFSRRRRVVLAMLDAMLNEERAIAKEEARILQHARSHHLAGPVERDEETPS